MGAEFHFGYMETSGDWMHGVVTVLEAAGLYT